MLESNIYRERLRSYIIKGETKDSQEVKPYPDLSISFVILSLGRRRANINRLINSLANEASSHDFSQWNSPYPSLEVHLLDTSTTKVESNRISSLPQNKFFETCRLSSEQRDIFFSPLTQRSPQLASFVSEENIKLFLPAESYIDLRFTDYFAQPTSLQRNRASILMMEQEEQKLQKFGECNPMRRIWITDDDALFWSTEADSPTGTLKAHKRFTPSIFEQAAQMLESTDTPFSVGSFSGDSPDPLLTLSNNLEIIHAVAKNADKLSNPDDVITPDSLHTFTQNVYSILLSEWHRNTQLPAHELSIPVNEAWWVGKTWREAAGKMTGLLQKILTSHTIPLTIMPDSLVRESSKDIVHTNFILSPETLLLYPYFLPPIGTTRRSEVYWARSTIDTFNEIGVKSEMGNPMHPSVFHRQNVRGRPVGTQIRWREQLFKDDGSKYPFRGEEVTPAIFNGKIERILKEIEGIPWMASYITTLQTQCESFKQKTFEDYQQESQKGGITLSNFQERKIFAQDYTLAWRQVCKELFPHLVDLFERKYNIPYDSVPVHVSFSTR